LLRRDAPAAVNYYNLVRPEIEFRNAIEQLQGQTTANQQAIADLTTPTALPPTGHRVGFQTQRRYFQTLGSGGTATGTTPAAGGTQAPARPPSRTPSRR
jgi:hypothetical protein